MHKEIMTSLSLQDRHMTSKDVIGHLKYYPVIYTYTPVHKKISLLIPIIQSYATLTRQST